MVPMAFRLVQALLVPCPLSNQYLTITHLTVNIQYYYEKMGVGYTLEAGYSVYTMYMPQDKETLLLQNNYYYNNCMVRQIKVNYIHRSRCIYIPDSDADGSFSSSVVSVEV